MCDVARLIEASLGAEYDGHEAFCCVANENPLGRPTPMSMPTTPTDRQRDRTGYEIDYG